MLPKQNNVAAAADSIVSFIHDNDGTNFEYFFFLFALINMNLMIFNEKIERKKGKKTFHFTQWQPQIITSSSF